MDRTYLATFITGQYASLLAASGASSTDDLSGFGPALDNVMTQLGLAVETMDPNPTITAGLEGDAVLLTRYYALDWLLGLFAMQVDRKTASQTRSDSQRFKQVQALLVRAQAQVPSSYALEPGDFEYGRVQLDFLEPNYAPNGTGFYPYP